jgi:hypothetical protein
MGSTVRPERFSKACISSSSAPRRRTEVGARLRDVRVSEPPLNGARGTPASIQREPHSRRRSWKCKPSIFARPTAIFQTSLIVFRRRPTSSPKTKPSAGRGVPAGSRHRRSRISRKTLDMGTRRSRLVFVFDAARKISARDENRICQNCRLKSSPRRHPVSSAATTTSLSRP